MAIVSPTRDINNFMDDLFSLHGMVTWLPAVSKAFWLTADFLPSVWELAYHITMTSVSVREASDREFGSRYLQFHKRDSHATSLLLSGTVYTDIRINFVWFITPFLSREVRCQKITASYFSGDQNICPATRFLNIYSPMDINNKYIPQSVKHSGVTSQRV
jgi:hypothetical protein